MTGKLLKKIVLGALLPSFTACSELSFREARLPAVPESAQIIIVGEVHDNPRHHLTQSTYIRALQPTAVAFEMLTAEQAEIANSMSDRGDALRDAINWQDSGWPSWDMYQPVFEATGDASIYGMALPRDFVRRAVSENASSVFTGDSNAFRLNSPLPESQQAAREAQQKAVHCNMLPSELLGGMVEAQRLRDASFALTALTALEQTGGPVVVITGTGHARKDWGMPAAIAAASPDTVVVSIGQLEKTPAITAVSDVTIYDHRLLADPVPREDPCQGMMR